MGLKELMLHFRDNKLDFEKEILSFLNADEIVKSSVCKTNILHTLHTLVCFHSDAFLSFCENGNINIFGTSVSELEESEQVVLRIDHQDHYKDIVFSQNGQIHLYDFCRLTNQRNLDITFEVFEEFFMVLYWNDFILLF